jgi:uncharacterized membrane protein YccC
VLAFFAVILLSLVVALPMGDRILGFAMALFIVANVHDSTPRQRLITIAVAPLVAFAAVVLATLMLDQPIAAAAVVPPIMFAISYGAARGPRYATVGIVGLIGYFIALVTREPIDVLPARLAVVIIAGASAALVYFVVLPERPQAELERLRHAIRDGIERVLARIAAAVQAGAWTDATHRELHRDVYRLGEIVMLADGCTCWRWSWPPNALRVPQYRTSAPQPSAVRYWPACRHCMTIPTRSRSNRPAHSRPRWGCLAACCTRRRRRRLNRQRRHRRICRRRASGRRSRPPSLRRWP